jgi:hypothetical protein
MKKKNCKIIIILNVYTELNIQFFFLYLGLEEPQVINPNPVLSFENWLSSVTERINQEMHYQFDGNPPTIVFHIHKVSNILNYQH